MREEVVGKIKIHYMDKESILFLTKERIIVARITDKLDSVIGIPAFGAIGGLIGGLISSRRGKKKREKLEQISPESILGADKKNFAIQYSDIVKVEMIKNPGRLNLPSIRVKMTEPIRDGMLRADKYTYRFGIFGTDFDEAVNSVSSVLSDKIFIS